MIPSTRIVIFSVLLLFALAKGTDDVERNIDEVCPAALLTPTTKPYLKGYGNHCYRFVLDSKQKKDYSDANRDCQKQGGLLVMPKKMNEVWYITKTLKETFKTEAQVWIGLHDKKEQHYRWEDGDYYSYRGRNFAKGNGWGNNIVIRAAEDCVILDPKDSQFYDVQCKKGFWATLGGKKTKRRYVCEYNLETSVVG